MNNSGREESGTGGRLDSERRLFRAAEFGFGLVRKSTERKRNRRTAAEGSDVARITSPQRAYHSTEDDCHAQSLGCRSKVESSGSGKVESSAFGMGAKRRLPFPHP